MNTNNLIGKIFLIMILSGMLFSANSSNLKINFSNMNPHIGQTLYLRVIDKGTQKETGRISAVVSANFEVNLDAVSAGRSYFIDFFADHNNNGLYDPPPSDHAWRLELNNASGNGSDELNFSHNTNFTDISWVYLLTIQFEGMTPHIGQLLELKVEDDLTSEEIGRVRIPSIPSASFTIEVPGLKLNREYQVDFYADLNGNGLYDAPPVDHAWQSAIFNNTGNFTLNFSHNANFTDISWKYLMTLNLNSMSPHVGQKFELRVVNQDGPEEIGRVTIPSILVADFTVEVPGIELGDDYNIDFYADLNGNGSYDPPPADHAWRLTIINNAGNYSTNFSHNVNFTDIQWPGATSVNDGNNVPDRFNLSQNYPNPFNPSTRIEYNIPQFSFVSIKLYDILGNEIRTLVNEFKEPGTFSFQLNATDLNSGVYFYKLEANKFTSVKKMILLK